MSILEQLISGIGGNTGTGASPIQGILASLLGGNQGVTPGMPTGGTGGGLQGLLSKFEGAGMGGVAQSWVGNGANQPVSPDQLRGVFGDNQVQAMSSQSGMAPHDLLSQLSQHLPNVVNGMTPNGRLPDEGSMSV